MKPVERSRRQAYLRIAVYIVLIGLFALLLVHERDSLRQAVTAIRQADRAWLTLGILVVFGSFPASALVYRALSPRPLRFGRTVLVQLAGFCVNKLLPSGSGAAGTSFLYLRANAVPVVPAGAVVALNNLLGLFGHLVVLLVLLLIEPSVLDTLTIKSNVLLIGGSLLASSLIIALVLGLALRSRLRHLLNPLRQLVTRPRRLSLALGASMLITLSYALSLLAAAEALGVRLSLTSAIVVLSASVLATSVVPTPGGIGAAEAGAYGGLVALGIDHDMALATALLYRVYTFWVPLVVGSGAFVVVARKGYLRSKP